jgi:hypothetical protein
MTSFYDGKVVEVDYTNWRGVRRLRRLVPRTIRFGRSEFHDDEQWLLVATCLESCRELEFSIKTIHSWRVASDQSLPWRTT